MAENNTNRTVMILAGAVVILLIAFVAVVVLNSGAASTQTASTTASTTTATSSASASTVATSNPGMASSTAAAFDPTTATKVDAKYTPKTFVAAYYQNILDKKFADAFVMQPKASQSGSVADFQSTQAMYGMTAFSIFADSTGSTEATVVVRQNLGTNGIWNATWTFVKNGNQWVVRERKVGMGEPAK
jgi:hypothetical protein